MYAVRYLRLEITPDLVDGIVYFFVKAGNDQQEIRHVHRLCAWCKPDGLDPWDQCAAYFKYPLAHKEPADTGCTIYVLNYCARYVVYLFFLIVLSIQLAPLLFYVSMRRAWTVTTLVSYQQGGESTERRVSMEFLACFYWVDTLNYTKTPFF